MSAILFGLIKYTSLSSSKRAIMWVLADHASDEGYCFPGRALLSKEVGISERHLRLNLQALEREGWLRMELGNGRGNPTKYQLNVPKIRREATEFERAFPIKGIPNNTPFPGDPLDKGCTFEDEKGIPSGTKGYTPRINEPSITINEPSLGRKPKQAVKFEPLTDEQRGRLKEDFPGVDVDEEIENARAHVSHAKWKVEYIGLRNWMKNARKFNAPRSAAGNGTQPSSAALHNPVPKNGFEDEKAEALAKFKAARAKGYA